MAAVAVVFSLVIDAIGSLPAEPNACSNASLKRPLRLGSPRVSGIGVIYQNLTNAHKKVKSIVHSRTACICRANEAEGLPMRFECRVHHLADHAPVEPTCRLTLARWRSGQNGHGRVCIQFQEMEVGGKILDA